MSRLDEIRNKLEAYELELTASRGCCDVVDFKDDVNFLLYHCEKLMDMVKNEQYWRLKYESSLKRIYNHEFSDNSYEEDWQDVIRIASVALQNHETK